MTRGAEHMLACLPKLVRIYVVTSKSLPVDLSLVPKWFMPDSQGSPARVADISQVIISSVRAADHCQPSDRLANDTIFLDSDPRT